jgi:hypothetical protein
MLCGKAGTSFAEVYRPICTVSACEKRKHAWCCDTALKLCPSTNSDWSRKEQELTP